MPPGDPGRGEKGRIPRCSALCRPRDVPSGAGTRRAAPAPALSCGGSPEKGPVWGWGWVSPLSASPRGPERSFAPGRCQMGETTPARQARCGLAARRGLEIPGRGGFRTSPARRGLPRWRRGCFSSERPSQPKARAGAPGAGGEAPPGLTPTTHRPRDLEIGSQLRDFPASSSETPSPARLPFAPALPPGFLPPETGGKKKNPLFLLSNLSGCSAGAVPGGDPCRNLGWRKPGSHLALSPPSLPSAEGCCPLVPAAPPELGAGARSHLEMFRFTFSGEKRKE